MVLAQIRPGAYYDSVVLMQLQRALVALPDVEEAGAVMGTDANKDVLAQSGLLTPEVQMAKADDLLIVVRAATAAAAQAALGQIDTLLAQRSQSRGDTPNGYRPKSLEAAAQILPAAQWVLVSTPGRYAAGVAREALRLGKHVFLYSDNVSVAEEVALKEQAAAKGLLVMGPDCGTAIVNGIGLGFANRVRRGPIGVVGASGTGLQQVTARIHQLGGGITHAFGTGGRDLSEKVGAITARQALALLARDPATQVIVLISKPPAAQVVDELLRLATTIAKPVIIDFIGYRPAEAQRGNIYFVKTLDEAAELAVELANFEMAQGGAPVPSAAATAARGFAPMQKYLRGLFSGGTLAYEAQLLLQEYVSAVFANAPLDKRFHLEKATVSQGHTIVDLGEDEFTVGRLHPMLDHELRIKRLHQEAADPETAVILLDVVLGYGAHPDPAGELAPAIAAAIATAARAGRQLAVIAIVVGTDEDPQNIEAQVEQLITAGATVEFNNETAVRRAGALVQSLPTEADQPVAPMLLSQPLAALNVGLESFTASLTEQGVPVLQLDWRPPAGGNERLAAILARMKQG
ncbi:MAG: acyl-CoA synthetase FdrA [Caldilineaceae bacterium]|nr:acyl-CoA synthetase FdrA [Caldilineaceae bacterium]